MDSKIILIGNIIALFGSGGMLISTAVKSKKGILKTQTVASVFLMASDTVLGGYSGSVQDLVCIIRNLTVIAGKKSKILNAVFIIASVALGIIFNNNGLLGLLPVFGNLQFSCIVLYPKADDVMLKISTFISNVCWALFCIGIRNYVNLTVDIMICISAAVFVIRELVKRHREKLLTNVD